MWKPDFSDDEFSAEDFLAADSVAPAQAGPVSDSPVSTGFTGEDLSDSQLWGPDLPDLENPSANGLLDDLLQAGSLPVLSNELRARVLSDARRAVPLRRRLLLVVGAEFAVQWLPARRVWLKSWSQISFGTARLAVRQREAAALALLLGLMLATSWMTVGWGAAYLTRVVQANLVPAVSLRATAFPSNEASADFTSAEFTPASAGTLGWSNRLAGAQNSPANWLTQAGQHPPLRSLSEPGLGGLLDYESSLIATEMAFRQRAFRWLGRRAGAG